jgi:hypothetical protein
LGGGVVELEVRMHNQDAELVHTGTWKVVMRGRA